MKPATGQTLSCLLAAGLASCMQPEVRTFHCKVHDDVTADFDLVLEDESVTITFPDSQSERPPNATTYRVDRRDGIARWDLEPNLQFYFNPASGWIAAEVGDIDAITREDEERYAREWRIRRERGELVEPFTGECAGVSNLGGNSAQGRQTRVAREELSSLIDRLVPKNPLPA